MVNHVLLMLKLSDLGLSEVLIKLFASYLSGRSNFVTICGHNSHHYTTILGVPQSSNLGPLLFSVFTNDITRSIKHSEILLFADDIKIYRKVGNNNDCEMQQDDFNEISHTLFYSIIPSAMFFHIRIYLIKHRSVRLQIKQC